MLSTDQSRCEAAITVTPAQKHVELTLFSFQRELYWAPGLRWYVTTRCLSIDEEDDELWRRYFLRSVDNRSVVVP